MSPLPGDETTFVVHAPSRIDVYLDPAERKMTNASLIVLAPVEPSFLLLPGEVVAFRIAEIHRTEVLTR